VETPREKEWVDRAFDLLTATCTYGDNEITVMSPRTVFIGGKTTLLERIDSVVEIPHRSLLAVF
jgi:hypothetical protein